MKLKIYSHVKVVRLIMFKPFERTLPKSLILSDSASSVGMDKIDSYPTAMSQVINDFRKLGDYEHEKRKALNLLTRGSFKLSVTRENLDISRHLHKEGLLEKIPVPKLKILTRTYETLCLQAKLKHPITHSIIPTIGTIRYLLYRIDCYVEDVYAGRLHSPFLDVNSIGGLVPFHLFSDFDSELSKALRLFSIAVDPREPHTFEDLNNNDDSLSKFVKSSTKTITSAGYVNGNTMFFTLRKQKLSGVTFYKPQENYVFPNSYVLETLMRKNVFYRAHMDSDSHNIIVWTELGEWLLFSLYGDWVPFGEKLYNISIGDCNCISNVEDVDVFGITYARSDRKWHIHGTKIESEYPLLDDIVYVDEEVE